MSKKPFFRLFPFFTGFAGVIMITVVLFNLLSYELTSRSSYPVLLNPLVEINTQIQNNQNNTDLTKASNWFGKKENEDSSNSKVEYFTITIPKLKINKATVAIGKDDLSESLIQYPGTALPGKIGNGVIFGHSVLPIFFNPKDYLTIFSTLPKLENGDDIFVHYDGVDYKYKVETKYEVLPTDIEILEQDTDGSYLSLVTCTPPGDPRKPRRLVVRAKIVPYTQANASLIN